MYKDLLEIKQLRPYWDTLKVLEYLFTEHKKKEIIFFGMNYFSYKYSELLEKNPGKGILVKKLAFLTLIGVINRYNSKFYPGTLAVNSILIKEKKGYNNFITFYKPNNYDIKKVISNIDLSKSKGITIRNLTYEVIQAQYSTEIASRCFPARHKHRQSNNTRKALKILENHIKGKEIISIKELRELLKNKYTKGKIENILKSFSPVTHDLVRYTKELKDLGTYKTNERVFIIKK